MKTKPHKSQDGTRQGEGGAWLGEMQAMEILGRTRASLKEGKVIVPSTFNAEE